MTFNELKEMGFKVKLRHYRHGPKDGDIICEGSKCTHKFNENETAWYETVSGYCFCSLDCLERWVEDTISR